MLSLVRTNELNRNLFRCRQRTWSGEGRERGGKEGGREGGEERGGEGRGGEEGNGGG